MARIRMVAIRLATAVPTVFIVATLTFGLLQLIPGSPAEFLLGAGASRQQIGDLEHSLGLDQPLLTEYGQWLVRALHGDFGDSITSNTPAIQQVFKALPVTVSVAVVGLVLTAVVGIGLGLLAALRGGVWDTVVQTASSVAMAVPPFWLASLLIYFLAIRYRIFYATDYSALSDSPNQWLLHVTLPAVAVAVTAIGQVAFQARASLRETLGQDFLRTLRSTGMSPGRILFKHVLRNGLVPVIAYLGMMFVFLLGGVVIVESIFSLPGLGALMIQSVNNHDLTVVQATVVTFCVLVVITNLAVDLLVGWLDPRARA
ncbi:ABC transporter permease [Streptomyces sp. NPDC047043]|uniref:ABC transporter permease n=1 Tax=Streptomyces sp. NPDC047043 TaxID=3154497 RepID=UPI0033D23C13